MEWKGADALEWALISAGVTVSLHFLDDYLTIRYPLILPRRRLVFASLGVRGECMSYCGRKGVHFQGNVGSWLDSRDVGVPAL